MEMFELGMRVGLEVIFALAGVVYIRKNVKIR